MSLVDQLQFGPFATEHHRALVNEDFVTAFQQFLERVRFPQTHGPIRDANRTLTAAFDHDRYGGPSSLVRNIFTFNVVLHSDEGTSELKADVVYDSRQCSFAPRTGHGHSFYLWTPTRKAGTGLWAALPFGASNAPSNASAKFVRFSLRAFRVSLRKKNRANLSAGLTDGSSYR